MEQILYFMLNNDWVITLFEKEKIIFPNDKSRLLASEIAYYYTQNGNINVADFYTYIQDKDEIVSLLNEILASNYLETTTKDDLILYFKVVKEYGKKREIKRLTDAMKKEVDPIEQAKIANKIRSLRIGE